MPVRSPVLPTLLLAASAAFLQASAAVGQPVAATGSESPVIGVAAPLSGPATLLARQVLAGAQAGAGGTARIVSADTRCEAAGGADAARRFQADGVRGVVGFLCAEALEAALPILREAGIPTIAVGVRATRITDERARNGNLVWRLGPRSDADGPAIVRAVRERWPDVSLALVDDGSPEARALVDALRGLLEAEGRAPAIAATLRAGAANQSLLVARLAASGARNVVVAAGPGDAAVLARDASAAGTPFAVLGGESLFDEMPEVESPDLPAGTLAVAPRGFYPTNDPTAPGAAVDPAAAGYRGLSAAAVRIVLAAIEKAGAGRDVPAVLNADIFETDLGPVSFDAKGDASLDPFALYEWRDGRFQSVAAAGSAP